MSADGKMHHEQCVEFLAHPIGSVGAQHPLLHAQVRFAIRALMYRSALEAELDPDCLSFTEAVFQICEAVADQRGEEPPAMQQWRAQRLSERLRRNVLPQRCLRINRRELKQVYHKYKPKKRALPPPEPIRPAEPSPHFILSPLRPHRS